MDTGMDADSATAQAQAELHCALDIAPSDLSLSLPASQMSLSAGDTLENAYLLAVSAVVSEAALSRAGDGSVDAELQALINSISGDLADDGVFAVASADLFVMYLDSKGLPLDIPDINRIVDSDGDGIPNGSDNCRLAANADQARGELR